MKNLYTTGEYLEKNPTWSAEDSPWKARQVVKMMARNGLQPTTVCEVGCGAGQISNHLHQQLTDNVNFTGYDISPQAYEKANELAQDRLRFRLRNFLDDVDEVFDLLLVIDVIEHVEDCLGFLRGVREKAKYKLLDISIRKVLFCVPMERRHQFGHIHYFMKETALATLNDTGYEIVDHFFTSLDLDCRAKSITFTLAKLLLKRV